MMPISFEKTWCDHIAIMQLSHPEEVQFASPQTRSNHRDAVRKRTSILCIL